MRRLGDWAFTLIILATGLGLYLVFGELMRGLVSSVTWRDAPCVVTEFWVDRPDPRLSNWVVRGKIAYRWEGEAYSSDRLALDDLTFTEQGYGEYFISQQKDLGERTCLVNPRDPAEAVLMRSRSALETASWWVGIGFTLLIVASGVWLVIGMLREEREG